MLYNELERRRDSWPPTVVRLQSEEEGEQADPIDENPFSFFLTSPDDLEDIDDFLFEDDAGIETPESRSPVREVSPSTIQRVPLPDLDEDEEYDDGNVDFGFAIPLSLKEFTIRTSTSGRKSRQGERADDHLSVGLGISNMEFLPSRGRAKVRLTPPSRTVRGRGQTRSLSARRKQSWRGPSPELWSIEEERDSDEDKKMDAWKGMNLDTPISMSAPASGRIGGMALQGQSPKPKKRVHWAI